MFARNTRAASRTKRHAWVLGASVALVGLLTAGCASSAATSGGSAGASGDASSPAKALKVGVIMLQGDTYYQGIQSGLEAAVKADGGSVVTGLSNNDPATEAQVAQNMIQAKVDAILMQPAGGDASLPTMKSITAAGITLICYGNCLGSETDPAVVKGVI